MNSSSVTASATDSLLDRASETPLWVQFRDAILKQILRGDLAVHAQLPSEAELGELFGISRIVVREGLSDLVRSGLIYKIKGKGAFVSARQRDEDFVSTVLGFSDEMQSKGFSVRTRVLEQDLVPAGEKAGRMLGVPPTELVTSLKRLRSVDGELRLLVRTHVPNDLAPGLHKVRLEDRSLYDVLRRQYGLRITRAERWIDPAMPDEETSALLQLKVPEPLLRIESVAYAANGRALEYYLALHRCHSSRLHVVTKT